MAKTQKKQDEQVQDLLKILKEKREKLANLNAPEWKANSTFKFGRGEADSFEVRTNSIDTVFISALGFLMDREKSFNVASKELDLEREFRWFGHTVEEWKEDFKTRLAQIEVEKEKAEVEILEAKVNRLMSPELKKQIELDKLTQELSTNN